MAAALLVLLAAPELRFLLRELLVLPCYTLLCGTCRLRGATFGEQRALLCEAHRTYNYVVESARAALLEGVFCPGIGRRASGSLCLDAAATTLTTSVLRRLAIAPSDSRPLAPFTQDCNGSVMAAWHIYNVDTPAWLCLSSLLADARSRVRFGYYCAATGWRYFVAEVLIHTFRFALIFEHGPAPVIDLD